MSKQSRTYNSMAAAFAAYTAKQNGMLMNEADLFAAGWEAGTGYVLEAWSKSIERLTDKNAPAEAATSNQREGKLLAPIISDRRA